MIHAMKVDLTCPLCPDEMGVLTATVTPEEIEDLDDAGCGHADEAWALLPTLSAEIYTAAADKEMALWDAECDRRVDRLLGK